MYKLSYADYNEFQDKGFLIIKDFYDKELVIAPIIKEINLIIELIAKDHLPKNISKGSFDQKYTYLKESQEPTICSLIYDSIKLMQSFNKWSHSIAHYMLAQDLLKSKNIGFCRMGDGVRIDGKSNIKFSAPWHQEFPTQGFSTKGVIFWTPLLNITIDLGPINIAQGSHKDGIREIIVDKPLEELTAYDLNIRDINQILSSYSVVAPCIDVGDLIVMDYFVLHASGLNVTSRERWSMQTRLFSFDDQFGINTGYQKANIRCPKYWNNLSQIFKTNVIEFHK